MLLFLMTLKRGMNNVHMVHRPESTVGALPSEVLFVEDASWPTSNRQALIIVFDVLLM